MHVAYLRIGSVGQCVIVVDLVLEPVHHHRVIRVLEQRQVVQPDPGYRQTRNRQKVSVSHSFIHSFAH